VGLLAAALIPREQDLLSQVISRIFACSLYSCRSAFAGGVIRIV
jgi:hypothetical protein